MNAASTTPRDARSAARRPTTASALPAAARGSSPQPRAARRPIDRRRRAAEPRARPPRRSTRSRHEPAAPSSSAGGALAPTTSASRAGDEQPASPRRQRAAVPLAHRDVARAAGVARAPPTRGATLPVRSRYRLARAGPRSARRPQLARHERRGSLDEQPRVTASSARDRRETQRRRRRRRARPTRSCLSTGAAPALVRSTPPAPVRLLERSQQVDGRRRLVEPAPARSAVRAPLESSASGLTASRTPVSMLGWWRPWATR